MNEEKLARTLLDESPEKWPAAYRSARPESPPEPSHRVPEHLRARIQESINNAAAGARDEVGRRRSSRVYWAAAAILPLAFAGAWFFATRESRSSYRMNVVSIQGKAFELTRNAALRPLLLNTTLGEGDALEIPTRGRLLLDANLHTRFEIIGPARLTLVRARGPVPDIRMNLEYGSLAIFSQAAKSKKNIVWVSGEYTFAMTGTVARLTVRGDERKLSVVKGAFKVLGPQGKKDHEVRAGSVLGLKASQPTRSLVSEDVRREMLAREQKILFGAVKNVETKPLDPRLNLKSEAAIRNHYGGLYRIILTNGTEYRGYPVRDGTRWRVHTIYGIVHAERKFIRTIEVLP